MDTLENIMDTTNVNIDKTGSKSINDNEFIKL